MKVTTLMADELINGVKEFSKGRNITESLAIALNDWLRIQKMKRLMNEQDTNPFEFIHGFSAEKVRQLNRKP